MIFFFYLGNAELHTHEAVGVSEVKKIYYDLAWLTYVPKNIYIAFVVVSYLRVITIKGALTGGIG